MQPPSPHSFMAKYLSYATLNEAPYMFGVWGGFVALSAAVGRRVWIKRGKYPVYPNIYVMYVAEAGSGKDYAMGFVSRLLEQTLSPDMISYDAETPEGLIDHMVKSSEANKLSSGKGCKYKCPGPAGGEMENHQMVIMANEFIDFMRGERERWTGMLCSIYSKSPYAYRTKGSGTAHLKGPYVVILGALTTEVCKDLQAQQIINTGFGRRCIMQHGIRQWENPVPEPIFGPEQEDAEKACLAHMKKLNAFSGEIVRTPEAMLWWKIWYEAHSKGIPTNSTPYNKTWMHSKSDQLLKVAMLVSLSERDDMKITPSDFEAALGYLNKMEEGLFAIFGGLGRNELAGVAVKVLNYIKQQKGPVAKADLERSFFNDLAANKGFQEMDEIIRHLMSTNSLIGFSATVNTKLSEYFIAREFALDWFAGEGARQFGATLSETLRATLIEERRLSLLEEVRGLKEELANREKKQASDGKPDESPQ